jgi:hypothetical protein
VRELGRGRRRNRRSPACRRACRPSEARGRAGTATSRGATNPSACAKTVIHNFCSSTKKPAQTQHTSQESPTGHRARGQLNDKPRTLSGLEAQVVKVSTEAGQPRRTAVPSLAGLSVTDERPGTAAQGQWDRRYRASARDAVRYSPEARQAIIATPAAPSPSRWSKSGPAPCSARPARISSRTRQPVWRSTPPGRSSGTSRPGRACADARTASG